MWAPRIFEVFERYNKLINDLNLHSKYYPLSEINREFLKFPPHLEHMVTTIRDSGNLSKISLERLYGVLKTYELVQIQHNELYGKGRVVSTSTALVVKVEDKGREYCSTF